MEASPERDNNTATFDPAWDIGEEEEKVRIVPVKRRTRNVFASAGTAQNGQGSILMG